MESGDIVLERLHTSLSANSLSEGGPAISSESPLHPQSQLIDTPLSPPDPQAIPAPSQPAPQILHRKKILVVEDSPDNQILIEKFLRSRGAEVEIAVNGQIGVEKAQSGNFDAVVMDIQMPIMDGYTATKTLRESGYRAPIIALTAHAMSEDRAKCLRAGCSDYLTKPIRAALLCETIQRHVGDEGFIEDPIVKKSLGTD